LDSSLVGSQISSDASCEESSIHEGAGYDEAFRSGDESEDFSPPSETEMSAQSLDGDESYTEGGKDEVEEERWENESDGDDVDVDRDDGDGDEESSGRTSKGPGDNCPFILPEDWAVNKFFPMMSDKVFRELRTRYQIPDHIPIRLPRENGRCYLGRTADVGMYDAMFAAGLRLPLTAIHHQLADFLGLSVTQIALNAWRTFIGAEILWGRLSGGNRQLTLDEFFYCYRPHHIASSKGTYHFNAREKSLRLVSDMSDSNRNWKSRYFFVEGTDWVYRQEEWAMLPHGYFDNTWAFVRDSG